jgi:hypothetical protein
MYIAGGFAELCRVAAVSIPDELAQLTSLQPQDLESMLNRDFGDVINSLSQPLAKITSRMNELKRAKEQEKRTAAITEQEARQASASRF